VSAAWVVKHTLDRVTAAALLLACSPVLGLCALAIKIEDRGPVFFRQDRLGQGGRLFRIWKLRSMRVDADALLADPARAHLPRVTRVGAFLRKTSLDEIPQLLNILSGEMSFIGPRPTLPSHWPRYTGRQKMRARVRPGVTGLAQIKGRNHLKWSRRIRYDNFYIEHYSLALDAWIFVRTVINVLLRRDVVLDRNPGQVDDLRPPATP
jgi:lipopolysaccharide/colanic/teichoic acid biosynthesis glycosyltransferase